MENAYDWKMEYYRLVKEGGLKNYSEALRIKKVHLPKFLYRYRSFDKNKLNRIRREIYGFIYLSKAKDFNDPYDTRSVLNKGKREFIENLKSTNEKSMLNHFSDDELENIFVKENWFDVMLVQGLIKEKITKNEAIKNKDLIKEIINNELIRLNNGFNNIIEEQVRISCFTERWNNLPMWYHYADKFNGYCIEYDTAQIENILYVNRLLPVQYVTEYRDIIQDFILTKGGNGNLSHLTDEYATTKLRDWSYENEWRLVLNLGMIYWREENIPEIVKKKGPELFFVKPSRILIGAQMDRENIEVLESECKEFGIKVVHTEISDSGLIIKE